MESGTFSPFTNGLKGFSPLLVHMFGALRD
jgi:hypothetical protein